MCKIELNREQLLTLVFHLRTMRNNIKKGLKKNHNRKEFKRYIRVYDSVFESLPRLSDDIDQELFNFKLTTEQHGFVQKFLDWYEKELQKGLSDSRTEDEQIGLDMLQEVKSKIDAA